MISVLIEKAVGAVALLVIVSLMAFGLSVLSPRHPEVHRLGADAPESAVREVRHELGLDRPLAAQFVEWAGGAVRGDLGHSYVSDTSVAEEIAVRAPRTLSMVALAIVIACALGLALGVSSALARRPATRRCLAVFTGLVQAVPGFWLGILLVTLFALQLGWLPATGYVPASASVPGWLQSILLPSIALGLPSTAAIARQLRGALAGELGEDYVRNAVAQGFDRMHIVLRHALRNAMGPAVTIIGFQVVVKLSTVVVVERVFAIDGLGTLALDAVFRGDTPVLLGCVMTFALIVVVVNLFVDLAYTWINPRTRAA